MNDMQERAGLNTDVTQRESQFLVFSASVASRPRQRLLINTGNIHELIDFVDPIGTSIEAMYPARPFSFPI